MNVTAVGPLKSSFIQFVYFRRVHEFDMEAQDTEWEAVEAVVFRNLEIYEGFGMHLAN